MSAPGTVAAPPTWTTWDGRQRCTPREVLRPVTEGEVARAVRSGGPAVRAVGAGHSFTPCALTDGTLLDLSGLTGIERVDGTRATVRGGTRLHALGPLLASRGLSLTNQGDIDAQSIAGAISTGTHGTGAAFGNLPSQVTGLRLVDGRGEVRELDGGDELRAARVALGALGVITAVTVECVGLLTLHRHDRPAPLEQTLDRLEELVGGHDHFELFVFPYTRTALTRATRRSHDPPEATPRWRRAMQEEWLENRAFEAICRIGRRRPGLVPRLNRGIARAMSGSRTEDHAHRVFATERRVRFTEMEYALPAERAREAVERCLGCIEDQRLPILFPLELRFSAGDDALLSPAHGRPTAYVAVHQFAGMDVDALIELVEPVLVELGGRPHWGKRHTQTAETLRPRYPGWDRFQEVRRRFDPDGIFANAHVRDVLGAPGAAS
jgi:L-gulonolactone oxidase